MPNFGIELRSRLADLYLNCLSAPPDLIKVIPFRFNLAHLYLGGDEKLHEFFPRLPFIPLSPVVISGGIEDERNSGLGLAATLVEHFLSLQVQSTKIELAFSDVQRLAKVGAPGLVNFYFCCSSSLLPQLA